MLVPHTKWVNRHRYFCELHRSSNFDGVPLSSQEVTEDVADLVDETFVRGILADELPDEMAAVEVYIEPHFQQLAIVSHITVRVRTMSHGEVKEFSLDFKTGRWSRTAQRRILQLREEGTLDEAETASLTLIALPGDSEPESEPPPLQTPSIVEGTLEDFGIRELGHGELVPDRPLLANHRMVEDAVRACLFCGASEAGGATLGAVVRLPQPLPGTSTRIVTILTTCVEDQRHTGQMNQWNISPAALLETARIADVRGMGESVITVTHTHGFNAECGNCNTNAACPLAECTHVSLMDYQVLESLFPGKSTVMPIAGRRLGATGNRPVLEIHAWRGGQVRPIRWQQYLD
jgi:hypothetical protein